MYLGVLGLAAPARPFFIVARRLSSCRTQTLELRLSSCDAWARSYPQHVEPLPRPEIKPVLPALEGRFLIAGPLRKSLKLTIFKQQCGDI